MAGGSTAVRPEIPITDVRSAYVQHRAGTTTGGLLFIPELVAIFSPLSSRLMGIGGSTVTKTPAGRTGYIESPPSMENPNASAIIHQTDLISIHGHLSVLTAATSS